MSFERLDLNLSVKSDVIHLIIVYRPPPSAKNGYTVKQFMSEFSSLLATSITSPGRLVIAGDFNFHMDDASSAEMRQFQEILDSNCTTYFRAYARERSHTGPGDHEM